MCCGEQGLCIERKEKVDSGSFGFGDGPSYSTDVQRDSKGELEGKKIETMRGFKRLNRT